MKAFDEPLFLCSERGGESADFIFSKSVLEPAVVAGDAGQTVGNFDSSRDVVTIANDIGGGGTFQSISEDIAHEIAMEAVGKTEDKFTAGMFEGQFPIGHGRAAVWESLWSKRILEQAGVSAARFKIIADPVTPVAGKIVALHKAICI